MSWVAVGIGVGTLAYGVGKDISANNKAKKTLKERPVYKIQDPNFRSKTIAENNAQQGLSDESLQIQEDNANAGLSQSLDVLMKSGGGVNSVSDIYNNFNENVRNLTLVDDQTRFRNQQALISANTMMSDELDKSFQLNQFAPWMDKMQKTAQDKATAQNMQMAGISMASNAITLAGQQGKFKSNNPNVNTQNKPIIPDNSLESIQEAYNNNAPISVNEDFRNSGLQDTAKENWILNYLYNK